VVVYPARGPGGRGRWRAVWCEGGRQRQCEAATEARLAARAEKICGGWRRMRRAWNSRGLS